MGGGTEGAPCEGEGADAAERRARCGAPAAAPHEGRERLRVRGAAGEGRARGPVRGASPARPLPLHVRAEPRRGLRRLLHVHRPSRAPRPPARPRRHLRDHLACAVRQARAVPATAGMGAPVVLVGRRGLRRRPRHLPRRAQGGAYQDGEGFALSVFLREGDDVYRTYFTRSRGVEAIGPVWSFLDRAPFGRQETWEDSPAGYPQGERYTWWRRHDEYEEER